MSSRLSRERLKEKTRVMWPWARLRVILNRAHRAPLELEPRDCTVEERAVCLGDALREVDDHEAVILARDLDTRGLEVEDRVIRAAVTAGHLSCTRSEREREHLVTETDPKDRELGSGEESLYERTSVCERRGGVTRAIGETDAVGVAREELCDVALRID